MMIVDCGRCARAADGRAADGRAADGPAAECTGCLVSALRDTPDGIADLTLGELRAIEVLELAGFEIELLDTPAPPVAVPMYRRGRHVA